MPVWWFKLSWQLEKLIRNYPNSEKPSRPWQVVVVDLFKCDKWYLTVFFWICPLTHMSDVTVIGKLKEVFARFGIPEIVRADNGSQFVSCNFQSFAQSYNFQVVISSPHYPQSNGCVEVAVTVTKSLLKNNVDISLALLSYHTTPLDCRFSPADMLMIRRLRSTLPLLASTSEEVIQSRLSQNREHHQKDKQADNYNRRHRVRYLPDLHVGEKVCISDLTIYGTIIQTGPQPHSYLIHTHRDEIDGFWFLHILLAKVFGLKEVM
ncbi:hypothetical protein PR048_025502 [Dryococelus australis]|uniref:Integrase catalytic domain-containing protein n=1 Tax=Dryococelus australis TaxID=614101 RepID=A0ABQ9GRG6_9NEOP|nr:hypothetical protein PR048_025502 [Dryococelus australis]